jgi:hypothetical protein
MGAANLVDAVSGAATYSRAAAVGAFQALFRFAA